MTKLDADCLRLIFDEFKTEKRILYSCLFINKLICNILVPILWKRHSWHCYEEESEKKLFGVILSLLPSSSKEILHNNDIKLPSITLSKTPLFNYINFCEFPKPRIIKKIIEIVLKEQIHKKEIILEQEIYKLFISQCKNAKRFMWQSSQQILSFPGAQTFFSQLESLGIYSNRVNYDDLYKISKICKGLNELEIFDCNEDNLGLTSLISVQERLKSVYVYHGNKKGNCKELSEVLAEKGNTINKLYLDSISIIPPSFLKSLINLTWLSIYNREHHENNVEMKEFRKYLAISEFPNLQYLTVVNLPCFKELAMLIEKTKGSILDIYIYTKKNDENTEALIKSIANNCPKIKHLSTYLEPKYFVHIKSLLQNCRSLKEIKLCELDSAENYINDDTGDELLDILTEFSPPSLTYITVSENWKYSVDAFERLFESFKERKKTLTCFDIEYEFRGNITEGHKKIVEKYIDEKIIEESNCFRF